MESKVLCEAPWEERKSQANIINWRPPSPMLFKNSSLVFFRHTNYQNVSIMHRESLAARCCKKIPVPKIGEQLAEIIVQVGFTWEGLTCKLTCFTKSSMPSTLPSTCSTPPQMMWCMAAYHNTAVSTSLCFQSWALVSMGKMTYCGVGCTRHQQRAKHECLMR